MQTYKTEFTLSPTPVETGLFKKVHKYCPNISTHEETTNSKVEGQVNREQKEFSEGDLRYPTPLHKSQQSFYAKLVDSNKVVTEEYKVNLCKDNFLEQAEVERVTDAPNEKKSETKVMPRTPTYEALLSPNTKQLLFASYSEWEDGTRFGFDRLSEEGFDEKSIVFPALQSKEHLDVESQEKDFRKSHIQNKIAKAMLIDANNNIITEKVILSEKAQSNNKENSKCPASEKAKPYNEKSLKENAEPHSPLTSQNVIKLSMEIVGDGGISIFKDSSLESGQLQLDEVKADDTIDTKKNENQLDLPTPINVFKSSLEIVGENGVISKSVDPTMKCTGLQLQEAKSNTKLNNKKYQEHFILLGPQNVPNSSQKYLEKSDVIEKIEESTLEHSHLQPEAEKDTTLNKESNQERFKPQNVEKLNEAIPDFHLSFGKKDEQSSPLTPERVAFEGREVTLKFDDTKTDSFQITEDYKATKKPFKTELKFSTPKYVATKEEARNVLQKKLNRAMKNTFKSEKKMTPKKPIRTETVPRNVQKSEQRRSLKYELMLDDITNEELYQSNSTPVGSLLKDNINSQTEENVCLKDGNYEKLGGENYIPDGNVEGKKKEVVSAPSYITETNLYLKRPQLKRLSRPDHEARKLWKDEESYKRVYTSEKHFLPRHRGHMTAETKRNLTKPYQKTQEHNKNHHEKRKGNPKFYKISCTTTQKVTSAEKMGKHLTKKDHLFSYKLNWCYRVPIHRKSQQQDNSSHVRTIREKEEASPQWTTTISFEQSQDNTLA